VRPIDIKIDYLPNVHGSALFSRGDTQVLSVTTLGKLSDKLLIDGLFNRPKKKFFHHYNFPQFAVNEIASYRGVSRREIGHGELVEKTFEHLLPQSNDFPYTIRAVSEVLSSDGSSSQASICATSLSLMTTGVPLENPAAGIAIGLINGNVCVDINGLEDKLGEMDFKIAGTINGITSLQLDVKNHGIGMDIVETSLSKAKKVHEYLLDEMKKKIMKARTTLPTQVTKCKKFYVEKNKMGIIIGPKGKTINQLSEETNSNIEIQNDGLVLIYNKSDEGIEKTYQAIRNLLRNDFLTNRIR
jgi:polyribonucleotide nucleotidyltransferase